MKKRQHSLTSPRSNYMFWLAGRKGHNNTPDRLGLYEGPIVRLSVRRGDRLTGQEVEQTDDAVHP